MAPSAATAQTAAEKAAGDAAAPLGEMLGMALSGDPVMLRNLAASLTSFSVRLIVALLILGVTLWLAGRVAGMVDRGISRLPAHRRHPADRTLPVFVSTLAKYVVIAVGVIAVLQQLGVQTTSVIAVLGAASLAVGLALQGTLSNVAAGVMLLLQRPYRVGDRVELNGRQGKVRRIDLFNTVVVDYDGLTLYLPNGKVFGDMIVNYDRVGQRRIDLTFGVDYEDDLDLAIATLLEIAEAEPRVLKEPAPWSKVTEIADSSVNVSLRCWAPPDVWMDTRFDLIKRVKETFDARGLNFPYPHQVEMCRDEARPKRARGAPAT